MNEKTRSRLIRFSSVSLVGLDSRTRSILEVDGLPAENLVFSAEPSGIVVRKTVPEFGDVLCLGKSLNGDGARICIRSDAGTVMEYRPGFEDASYVNKDIEKFRDILKLFDTRSTFHLEEGDEDELDVLLRISDEFRSTITAIDSSALVEGDGFWGTILMEISSGDWSGEDLYLIAGHPST